MLRKACEPAQNHVEDTVEYTVDFNTPLILSCHAIDEQVPEYRISFPFSTKITLLTMQTIVRHLFK